MPTADRQTSRLRPRRLVRAALLFTIVSVLSGLLVAGVALPVVGAAWFAVNTGKAKLGELPVAFDIPAQSQRSRLLDANGKLIAYFYDENRVYAPLNQISPIMRQALVAIEDHRFYQHGPLDVQGTFRAFLANVANGGVTQGGSSLTQQYVKMVLIEEAKRKGDPAAVRAAQDDSYGRKIRELRYAISVEKTLAKDQILERYLNLAYFGDGAYGVEAAAQHYFGTSAARLTLPQAALLAGLVQNPTGFDPVAHPAAGLDRRNLVLSRMAELGVISAAHANRAKRVGFDAHAVRNTINGCQGTEYPFVCDYAYRALEQTPSLGATVADRDEVIKRGGLTITTTLDPQAQDEVQQRVNDVVGPTDPLISAMDMIQPGTGRIVAMAQSRPVMGPSASKGETYWNYSVPPEMGGSSGFQAGSTFKAFTAAAALAKGIPLSQRFDAQPTMDFSGASFESCQGSRQVSGGWRVSNSTGTNGVMDMYTGAEFSVNTYFVQLALKVGMCDVTKMAEKLGVESSTKAAPIRSYDDKPSFTLGTAEVSPLSMAQAYATFAAGGIHCDPIILDHITDSNGKSLAGPGANCTRVISSDVAAAMNSLLSAVMTKGTGARVETADHRPQAGKTGTIDSNAAVWFLGYTPQVAGAAMISVDNLRKPFEKSAGGYRSSGLKGYRVPSTGVWLEGSGSGDAGKDIWKPVMDSYLQAKPASGFAPPAADLVFGRQAPGSYGSGGSGGYGGGYPAPGYGGGRFGALPIPGLPGG
jgi:membrane peptidoglycan carboxypeptidase